MTVAQASRQTLAGLLLFSVLFTIPHQAVAGDGDVVTTMTAGKIERLVNSFQEVEKFKEVDNNLYSFEVDGLKIFLHNGGETMQLFALFNGRATLTRLNEWNRKKKFTRAFLDKDDNPVLDHSIELNGGVTEKNVKEWLATFVISLGSFKKHLEE